MWPPEGEAKQSDAHEKKLQNTEFLRVYSDEAGQLPTLLGSDISLKRQD